MNNQMKTYYAREIITANSCLMNVDDNEEQFNNTSKILNILFGNAVIKNNVGTIKAHSEEEALDMLRAGQWVPRK